jgi:hypothetical protein
MSIQLPLPAGWVRSFTILAEARDRLDDLRHDRLEAKAEIRSILDRLAERHRIAPRDVAIEMGVVDDLLSDLTYEVERELELEVDAGLPLT